MAQCGSSTKQEILGSHPGLFFFFFFLPFLFFFSFSLLFFFPSFLFSFFSRPFFFFLSFLFPPSPSLPPPPPPPPLKTLGYAAFHTCSPTKLVIEQFVANQTKLHILILIFVRHTLMYMVCVGVYKIGGACECQLV